MFSVHGQCRYRWVDVYLDDNGYKFMFDENILILVACGFFVWIADERGETVERISQLERGNGIHFLCCKSHRPPFRKRLNMIEFIMVFMFPLKSSLCQVP